MKEKTFPTSVRLTEREKLLLKALVEHFKTTSVGEVSENDIIRLALKRLAEGEGIMPKVYKLQTFEGHFEGYGDEPIHSVGEIVEIHGTLNEAKAEAKRIQHAGDPANERRVTIWENGLAKEGGRSVEEVNPWTERNHRYH